MEVRKLNRFGLIALSMAWAMCLTATAAEPAAVATKAPPATKEAAPPKPALLYRPPAGWTFPVAKLETLKPSAADVLTKPESVKGDFTIAKTPPVIEWGLLPGQWPGARLKAWQQKNPNDTHIPRPPRNPGEYNGLARVDYPIKLTKVIVAMPSTILYVNMEVPVERPVVFLDRIGVLQASAGM